MPRRGGGQSDYRQPTYSIRSFPWIVLKWINACHCCPRSIITDGHGSFRDSFADNLERSCRNYSISFEAPWQNGNCERHAGMLKSMMCKAKYHRPCTTLEEWDEVAVQVNVDKADLATRDGYSPNMLAFRGKPNFLPSSTGLFHFVAH